MSADSETPLCDLFVEVTGEETVTEDQAEEPSHEVLEEDTLDEAALSDGLDDAMDSAWSETGVAE